MSLITPKMFVERIVDSVSRSANSQVLYGEPIESDGILLIPVSRVRFGFGAGVARKYETEPGKVSRGGGGGVDAQPIGYIEIKDGEAKFMPLKYPISFPAVILASGFAGLFVLKGLARLFRR